MIYSPFYEPVGDLFQGFGVWHICIIKARCVDEYNGMPILGMSGSDRSNSRCSRFLPMVNRIVTLIASSSNELRENIRRGNIREVSAILHSFHTQ